MQKVSKFWGTFPPGLLKIMIDRCKCMLVGNWVKKERGQKIFEMISACGLICEECPYYKTECVGCIKVTGKTFWANTFENKTCPLFDCAVNNHRFNNCSECNDLPCNKFNELKDPNITLEEHVKSINDRVNRLKQK